MTSIEETAKKIRANYPGLSDELVARIMPNVFSWMAELKFPRDGDDAAYAEWFKDVYLPAMQQAEEEMHLGDWY